MAHLIFRSRFGLAILETQAVCICHFTRGIFTPGHRQTLSVALSPTEDNTGVGQITSNPARKLPEKRRVRNHIENVWFPVGSLSRGGTDPNG